MTNKPFYVDMNDPRVREWVCTLAVGGEDRYASGDAFAVQHTDLAIDELRELPENDLATAKRQRGEMLLRYENAIANYNKLALWRKELFNGFREQMELPEGTDTSDVLHQLRITIYFLSTMLEEAYVEGMQAPHAGTNDVEDAVAAIIKRLREAPEEETAI